MFTNHILITQVARQRQSDMLATADRHRLARRSRFVKPAAPLCTVIDLPAPRAHSHGDALVA
jgi:hypothetical protein